MGSFGWGCPVASITLGTGLSKGGFEPRPKQSLPGIGGHSIHALMCGVEAFKDLSSKWARNQNFVAFQRNATDAI